jgi:iron complex outermembrane receptor protein
MALNEIELEGIVVEDARDQTKLRTTKTQSKTLESLDSFGKTAGDLVQGLSGVTSVRSGQNLVKPMVHGLHSNRVLIINNGVRHAYQAWGRDHAPEIDPNEIDQLQLVKGAGTVRYGPEALGGVIIFDPKHPQIDQPLNAEIGTGYATNGRSLIGSLDLSQGSHRFAWKAGISGTRQGDLQAADYNLTNTGKRELGYHLHGILHQPTFDIELYASHFDQSLGILRGSVVGNLEDLANAIGREPPQGTADFSYTIQNPRQETTHDLYKVRGSFFVERHEINVQYALQRNLRQEFDIRRGTNNDVPSINLEMYAHTIDLDWKYPTRENWDGVVGMQWNYHDNNNIFGTNTIPFIPNYNLTTVGIFSIHSHQRGATTYEAGARYDFQYLNARGRDQQNEIFLNELTYHNVTFTIGFLQKLSEKWTINSNVGTAWRPPNVGELYSFGKHQFNVEYGLWRYELDESGAIRTSGVLDDSDKPIKSERGIKWIAGIARNGSKLQFEVVPYLNYLQHYFFTRPYGITNTTRGPFPYFIHDQTNALFAGVDVDVRIIHSASLESEMKMAYVQAQDLKNEQPFLEIPPMNLSYSLSANRKNWKASLIGEWTTRQSDTPRVIDPMTFVNATAEIDRSGTFDFMPAPAGYILLHARVLYQRGNWKGLLEINNLLNTDYRTYTDRLRYFADDLGRNIRLGINYRLSK